MADAATMPTDGPADGPAGGTEPLHRALGLTDDELADVEAVLGRSPNHLELALYAVMWSEHCSYKSSRLHLRRLPTEGERVLVGPGENAGVIDAGDGIAVAIRIESHNHPSAIEPYQGAATGVGGILRDIFTMGARPLAVMDPLFFGPLTDARQRWLFEGVVAGISGYGNSVGVPTVGGELTFDPGYAQNPLVNVLCLGALPVERLVLSAASGPGNLAVLLGSTTGRDGIGGVSVLASAGFAAVVATRIFAGEVSAYFRVGPATTGMGLAFSLALVGAGHLIGLSVGLAILAGLIVAWGVATPVLTALHPMAGPAADVATAVWSHQVRFIGAGAIGVAAMWTLGRLAKPVAGGVASAIAASRHRAAGGARLPRVERDIPIGLVGIISLLCLIPLGVLLATFLSGSALSSHVVPLVLGAIAYVVVAGFLVAAACDVVPRQNSTEIE